MAIMPPLNDNPTLAEFQSWVREMKAANGWTPTDFRHELALLVEEVGEVAKAHRKQNKSSRLTADQRQTQDSVGEELADILIYLFSLANIENIDLPAALQAKLAKNREREWVSNKVVQQG